VRTVPPPARLCHAPNYLFSDISNLKLMGCLVEHSSDLFLGA
jgi:hypothetical protein